MAKDMLNKFERLELKTMNRKTPKTTDGLMRHIRDNKGIQINGSTEKPVTKHRLFSWIQRV